MKEKGISGIIANYNGGRKVLKSVRLCLEYCDEVILVDDCSNDESYKELKKIKNQKLKIFQNKKNSGASYSRNFGAKTAKFNRLFFIDNDCYLNKNNFKKILGLKESIVYPKIVDSNGEIYNRPSGYSYIRNSVCFLIDKNDFKRMKGFDEKIKIYMDDVEFFFRCYKENLSLKYVKNSIGIHDSLKNNKTISRNFFKNLKNTIYFCLKHKRFGLRKDEFPNLLTIFANLRRCLINKDRFYGSKISENKAKALFLWAKSIIDGIKYYKKNREEEVTLENSTVPYFWLTAELKNLKEERRLNEEARNR